MYQLSKLTNVVNLVDLNGFVSDNKELPEHAAAHSTPTEEFDARINEFKKMCSSFLVQPNMTSLSRLMKYFRRHVSSYIHECNTKGITETAKIKECINYGMLSFMYFYRILLQDQNRHIYLDIMSDLVAMFIDLELQASRRSAEDYSKISERLTSCLYVYLDHSIEYMFNTLMKLNLMIDLHRRILNPVIMKALSEIQKRPESASMYVRYILVNRLWMEMNNNMAVKKQVFSKATSILSKPPTDLSTFLSKDILPSGVDSGGDSTKYFLEHSFDTKKSCQLFLQHCSSEAQALSEDGYDQRNSAVQQNAVPNENKMSSIQLDSKITSNINNNNNNSNNNNNNNKNANVSSNNLVNSKNGNNSLATSDDSLRELVKNANTESPNAVLSENLNLSNNKSMNINRICRKKLPKNGEILFIDLTNDSPNGKVISKIKKPFWLQNFEKQKSENVSVSKNISSLNVTLQSTLVDTFKMLTIQKDDVPVNKISPEDQPEVDKNSDNITEDIINTTDSSSLLPKISESQSKTAEIDNSLSSQTVANDSSPESVLELLQFAKNESHSSNKITEILPVAESQCNVKNASASSLDGTFKTDVDIACMKMDCAECSSPSGDNKSGTVMDEPKKQNELVENTVASLKETVGKKEDDQSKVERPLTFSEDKTEEPKDHSHVRYPIQESENIDGLILLASVSQEAAPIKIDSYQNNLIKVKDYSTLKKMDADKALALPEATRTQTMNEVLKICPEATFEIEVSSTTENTNYVDLNDMQNNLVFGADSTNVILNGETVVLLPKFPNSNLYIINKAVENKTNNGEEEINDPIAREELLPEHSESFDRVKIEMDNEDVKSKMENINKCTSYVCRQEIKHDFRVANYGIQKYSSMHPHDLVDPQIPLTMPTIYANFPTSSDLCISCHNHCNSMPRDINPIKSSTSRCSVCSTYACEVMSHCRQCAPHGTCIENNSYYLSAQPSVITRSNGEVMMMDLYENQLLRKIESEILDGKSLEEVDMNYKTEMKRHTEKTSKLPLKKRLKAHMMSGSYTDLKIKVNDEFLATPVDSSKLLNNPKVQSNFKTMEIDVPVAEKTIKTSPKVTKEKATSKRKSSKVDYSYSKQDFEWTPTEVQSKDSTYRRNATTDLYSFSRSCDQPNKPAVQEKPVKGNSKHEKSKRKVTKVNCCRTLENSWTSTEPLVTSTKNEDWKATSQGKQETTQEKAAKGSKASERASKRKIPKINYTYPEYSEFECNTVNTTKRRRKTTR